MSPHSRGEDASWFDRPTIHMFDRRECRGREVGFDTFLSLCEGEGLTQGGEEGRVLARQVYDDVKIGGKREEYERAAKLVASWERDRKKLKERRDAKRWVVEKHALPPTLDSENEELVSFL